MSNLDQINTIKANTLAQMAEVSAQKKPSYSEANVPWAGKNQV